MAKNMKTVPIWVATQTFHVGRRTVTAGEKVADGDPILDGREKLFDRIDLEVVETATKAPGETRKTPARKPSTKKASTNGKTEE